MKISEMTNDQATQALVRLSGPIAHICEDKQMEKLIETVDNMGKQGGMTVWQAGAKVIPQFVTFALAKHKGDLYEIVGALLEKKTSEVGQLNFLQTLAAVKDSYDDVLAGFFPHFAASTAKDGETPVQA